MKSGIKSKALARSAQLIGMASRVASKEISQSVRERLRGGLSDLGDLAGSLTPERLKSRVEQAKLIAESLASLKGAAMKAGQLLSLDAADYFPPEAVEILSRLQANADPVDFALVRQVLFEDLGSERMSRLEGLETEPRAAASIGQVHYARYAGREIALKVQYPGVRESIDSDLAVLSKLARGLITLSGRRIDLDELFAELGQVLRQEADYQTELANMREYGRLLRGDEAYVVPEPVAEMSAARVLTMTWEPGVRVQEWLKTNPTREDREALGRSVLDLYCREFFEWGFVQTDPNYGNFLVRTSPLRLVVLDFGATLRYSIEFRRAYVELLKAIGTRDPRLVREQVAAMGLLDPRENETAYALFFDLLMNSIEPFNPGRQPFRFRDEDHARRARDVGARFTASLKYSPPPRQILFLHRKLGGIFALLKRMDVQLDLTPYWRRMVGTELRPG